MYGIIVAYVVIVILLISISIDIVAGFLAFQFYTATFIVDMKYYYFLSIEDNTMQYKVHD